MSLKPWLTVLLSVGLTTNRLRRYHLGQFRTLLERKDTELPSFIVRVTIDGSFAIRGLNIWSATTTTDYERDGRGGRQFSLPPALRRVRLIAGCYLYPVT